MFNKEQVTGTLVNYYATCKREAWLYAHHIHADQEDENVAFGKAMADIKEQNLQEFAFANLKFDKLSKERGHYVVTEYKKSLKNEYAAKMQLLFYIYLLKTGLNLKEVKGKIISGKKVVLVEDSDENFAILEQILGEIEELANMPVPPKFEHKKICDNCAYRNYCI
ncbi:CRISPR-associated protein Cas4 [Campylobacter sp. RM12920]|uniref:CRISPR-associated exonuclease Cas4 n=1 Tax=Campylobacter californiensis TaxID=1032243 RepID=A0ABD4JKH1_9BACT|nr:CRISPR-associated protein Cas4 [Campylobacter sp. RM12919]MBE2988453.1 CRISPR-associated protein Cas4 [Campylobacter sp. RM12920]